MSWAMLVADSNISRFVVGIDELLIPTTLVGLDHVPALDSTTFTRIGNSIYFVLPLISWRNRLRPFTFAIPRLGHWQL
jgi:hypothetical protein